LKFADIMIMINLNIIILNPSQCNIYECVSLEQSITCPVGSIVDTIYFPFDS